jgi:hypothetical protein
VSILADPPRGAQLAPRVGSVGRVAAQEIPRGELLIPEYHGKKSVGQQDVPLTFLLEVKFYLTDWTFNKMHIRKLLTVFPSMDTSIKHLHMGQFSLRKMQKLEKFLLTGQLTK